MHPLPIEPNPRPSRGQYLTYQVRYETLAEFEAGVIRGGGEFGATQEIAIAHADMARAKRIAASLENNFLT